MSDGMGPYRHGEKGLIATGNFAVSLCTDQRTCTTYPEHEPEDPAQRALILDLRSPVLSSNAKDRGTVRAAAANFGAFWGQDKAKRVVINGRDGWIIRSVLDMEIGTTIQSERIEIRFFMNGAQHVLQSAHGLLDNIRPTKPVLLVMALHQGLSPVYPRRVGEYRAGQIVLGGFGTTVTPHIPSILGSTVFPTMLSSIASDHPLLCRLLGPSEIALDT